MMYTGNIKRVHADKIQTLLDNNNIVLIPHIAHSSTGHAYNLTYTDTTRDIAASLNANKIITFHDGTYHDDNNEYLLDDALSTCHNNEQYQDMFRAMAQAVKKGVRRAHILPYQSPNALLTELFTPKGYGEGIMITPTNPEIIRPCNS